MVMLKSIVVITLTMPEILDYIQTHIQFTSAKNLYDSKMHDISNFLMTPRDLHQMHNKKYYEKQKRNLIT